MRLHVVASIYINLNNLRNYLLGLDRHRNRQSKGKYKSSFHPKYNINFNLFPRMDLEQM